MEMVAKILIALVALEHVYIFIFEAFMWEKRGPAAFGISREQAAMTKDMASNQGCYNAFLAAALFIGLFLGFQDAVGHAFILYGLGCVIVAALWGAFTVTKRILIIQGAPAILAMIATLLAGTGQAA